MTVAQAKKNATNGEIDSRKELSKVLLSISEKYGLSQQDCEARVIAFQQVREFLESFNKGEVELFLKPSHNLHKHFAKCFVTGFYQSCSFL